MSYLNHNNLYVSGAGTVGGNLNVSTLNIKNNISVSGTLVVTGITTFNNLMSIKDSLFNIHNSTDTAYAIQTLSTNSGNIGVLFGNGPTKTDDGKADTFNIRNDVGGDIRIGGASGDTNNSTGFVIINNGNITSNGSITIRNALTVTGSAGGITIFNSSLAPFDNAQLLVYQAHNTTNNVSIIRQQKNSTSGIQDYYWELLDSGNFQLVQAAYNGAYNYVSRIFFNKDGMLGIGTQSPTQASVVIGNSISSTIGSSGYLNSSGATGTASGAFGASLWATGDIAATTIRAFSDRRIKKNITNLNDNTCLEQLRLLQPTQYDYIDQLQRGSSTVIGFIAQDVKNIIPHAVSIIPNYIPSILTTATVSNTVLTFDIPVDTIINSFTKLKLYDIYNKDIVTNITEVLSSSQLIISETLAPERLLDGKIFVYGHEVPDFHQLDKNTIFTISVGAIQELDRRNTELQTELSELKSLLISKGLI